MMGQRHTDMEGLGRALKRMGATKFEAAAKRTVGGEADIAERMFDRETPIRTGLMRRSWRRLRSGATIVLRNDAKGKSKQGYAAIVFFRKRMPALLDRSLTPRIQGIVDREFRRA